MNAGDCCPMQLALHWWEALFAQALANRKAQEQVAHLVQAHRGAIQGLREVVQANRVIAEATLLTLRGAQGCCEMPCQVDELQAWFHDAHGVAGIAKASVDGYGNAVGESEVLEVPSFGEVALGGGWGLPHAPLRSNGAGDWEVIEDSFLDAGEDGPRTPPRRCGVECHSTPPKTTLLGDGRIAVAGSEDALNGEEGPPTQCVAPAFPTLHEGPAGSVGIKEVVGAMPTATTGYDNWGQFAAMPGADGGSRVGILASSLPRPPEVAEGGRVQAGEGQVLASARPRPPEPGPQVGLGTRKRAKCVCSWLIAGHLCQHCEGTVLDGGGGPRVGDADCHVGGLPSDLPAVAQVQGGAGVELAGALPRPPEARGGLGASAEEKAVQEAELWMLAEVCRSDIVKLK